MKKLLSGTLCFFLFLLAVKAQPIQYAIIPDNTTIDVQFAFHSAAATAWYRDADGDRYGDLKKSVTAESQPKGYVADNTDCNDADAAVHPNACDKSDGIDNDCDGKADEDAAWYYFDNDMDGYGNKNGASFLEAPCNLDPDDHVSTNNLDCDDDESNIHPGATEVCNNLDDDCDGLVDEGCLSVTTWYRDNDVDEYGDPNISVEAEEQPDGYVANNGDCDDTNIFINEGASEICDGKDNDCDGVVDDSCDKNVWFEDSDGDGYGNPDVFVQREERPEGYVDNYLDCNDFDDGTNPDAWEFCDGFDNNCDGLVDNNCSGGYTWYRDADEDGFGNPMDSIISIRDPDGYVMDNKDCDDTDKNINPGVVEICNGRDDDCDGQVDEGCNTGTVWFRDADGDGWGNAASTKVATTQPRGYVSNNQDCDDKNKTKGGPEVCDGGDNDCDGIIDNGFAKTPFYSDWDGDGFGSPKRMKMACAAPPRYVSNSGDCNDDNASVYPGAPELCDGRDNDCNGKLDDGLTLKPFYWDGDKDGYGFFRPVWACAAPRGHTAVGGDFDDEDPTIHPGAIETCDGVDEDCDGVIDDGFAQKRFYKDKDGDGWGSNSNVMAGCAPPGYVDRRGDCKDTDAAIHPGAVEVAGNGVDENCNGQVDEAASVITQTQKTKAGIGEQGMVKLQLTAVPNPATHYFTLRIESGSREAVQVRIVDAVGRVVEARQGIAPNSTLAVGHHYKPGVYYAQVLQAAKQAKIKLIKISP
jgi:hypothetical protein